MDKKINIQILFVEVIRFFFIFIMILGVSLVSIHNGNKDVHLADNTQNVLQNADFQILTEKNSETCFCEPQPNENSKTIIREPRSNENSKPIFREPRSKFRRKKERLFHPIILQAASRHDIDPALIKAIIMAESGYNPNAISKRGAKGLMQLMPSTAEALGVEDVFNPEQNISGGVRYFKRLVNRFEGDVKLALAAYNAGSKIVRQYQGVPPYKSTRYYIKKVFKYYELYKEQMTEKMKKI